MAKSPGMFLVNHVQNLTWESAQEPPFTFPDVPVQVGAAHASPGVLCSGKIATGSNGFSGLNSDWKVSSELLVAGNVI